MASNVQVTEKFKPASEAQRLWLQSRAELLLGGGSVGSLKTSTMLVDGSVEYDNSNMHTIMFRRTLGEHAEAIRISRELFSQTGGLFNENAIVAGFNGNSHVWKWPWGSTFQFAYCGTDDDVYQHQTQSYTCILWDESTFHSEFQVRYLLTRLRSTDTSLFPRCRLGTNPGGPHMDWHMKMFLGGVCPHCQPPVLQPGVIYNNAHWPSDNRSLEGMTTQFIFSRLADHNLLGEKYVRNVRMQHAATADALLAGCWRAFEGQYFNIWQPARMVVPRQSIGEKWYWNFWVGADYGFSGSKAVAYLCATDPNGLIYILDEYVAETKTDVRDFAKEVYERFAAKKNEDDQPRKLHTMYLSPDSWNDRGDHNTLAGQMNDVLRPHGLNFVPASSDRAGGAMLIYELLRDGRLLISDTCQLLCASLESRTHDKKEPEKVAKVVGDPRDDAYEACVIGGTQVTTECGQRPIEAMVPGDKVLTRGGMRAVSWVGMTKPQAETIVLTLDDGRTLIGTPEHPVWVEDSGFKRLDSVKYGDIVLTCQNETRIQRPLASMALTLGDTQTVGTVISESTTGPDMQHGLPALGRFTRKCGRLSMALSQKASMFITRMRILCTMRIPISNCYQLAGIYQNISPAGTPSRRTERKSRNTSKLSGPSQPLGIVLRRVGAGLGRMLHRPNLASQCDQLQSAPAVEQISKVLSPRDFAVTPASRDGDEMPGSMTLIGRAPSAGRSTEITVTASGNFVPRRVLCVNTGPTGPVYNLGVRGDHPEFFANGILVHNCRYAIYSHRRPTLPPADVRIAERLETLWKTDPTTAMHQANKIMEEERVKGQPGVYSGAAKGRLSRLPKRSYQK